MKFFLTVLLLVFFTICAFSQQEERVSVSLYSNPDYFHDFPQEKFFIHTNKTTYFTGESIWWKAYIVSDFSNKPTTNTTNLHVSFYNSEKKLVSHQLFYVDAGKSYGELVIPNHLPSGAYYISIGTQWQKNYGSPYVADINVINVQEPKQVTTQQEVTKSTGIKMQFYPESGILINNINNTVFYTIQDSETNQYIPSIKGVLIDNGTGEEIASIEGNAYGQGMFKLGYLENHTYSVIIDYDSNTFRFELPKAKSSGLIIQKDEGLKGDKHEFVIQLTEDLANDNHSRTFFATIHRNNKGRYLVPLTINKEYKKYLLPISTDNFFEGVNTITVFNDKNQPLAERHFFNHSATIDLEVFKKEATKDSVLLDFQLKNKDAITNLSISILPKDSKLNDKSTNIQEAFLLDPYLHTPLPPGYQFNGTFSYTEQEMDVLLQILAKPIKKNHLRIASPNFNEENGISIKGVVNTSVNDITEHRILLSSTANEILLATHLNSDKSFEFNKLVLKDSANYKLALLNKKGEIVKAGFYVYKKHIDYKEANVLSYHSVLGVITKSPKQHQTTAESDHIIFKGVEQLDEVVLHGKKRQEELVESLYPNNPKELGSGWTKNIMFDEHQELNLTVIDFLNTQPGVKASDNPKPGDEPDVVDFISVTFSGGRNTFYGSNEALIVVNNIPVDNERLHNMRLSEVKSVKINSSGAGYGVRGSNGVILIETKSGSDYNVETLPNPNYFSGEVDFGFSSSAPVFKASLLQFDTMQSRSYYETLDWIPNFNIVNGTQNNLNIYKGEHKHIKLFINGMNSSGQLIYKVVDLVVE